MNPCVKRTWLCIGLFLLSAACGPGGEVDPGGAGPATAAAVAGHYQLENLDRGVVAVKVSGGVYVGWRMLGWEYDPGNPAATAYAVYRDGSKLATVTGSTNYLDAAGAGTSTYAVAAVLNGVEQAPSAAVPVWAQAYLRVPLQVPPAGTTPSTCPTPGEGYTYSASDASVGDLDGDGQYELVLKWEPSNAKDNSQSGCTGNVYLDAYELSGARLWRVDLGRNIRAGAHYTQFVVYDLDGDGKAELAVKTAPGTRDGTGAYLRKGPAASDSDTTDYRDASGYVLSGPEYLTVFAGPTGAELATVNFEVARGTVSSWGDSYGNRVDRFLASVGFVSDAGGGSKAASGRPSILMARGYYTRATITAWNFRNGALTRVWKADSNDGSAYTGQGAHTMAMADVDGDGAQEVIYGASVVNSNGTARCSTGFGHGDALHVGAFVPGRTGLQVFMPHEDTSKPSWDLHDASTCQVLRQGAVTGKDTGRGVADDVYAGSAGAELWASGSGGLLSASSGSSVGSTPASTNFLVWWDADESRELEDGVSVTKYGGGTLTSCSACASNNGTKSTPALTADLLGDWREEVVWRESDSSALRVYTTTDVTSRRIYTLMHDPQYRAQVSSEQTAYNQPPHPSFAIGSGMAAPPRPDITAPGAGGSSSSSSGGSTSSSSSSGGGTVLGIAAGSSSPAGSFGADQYFSGGSTYGNTRSVSTSGISSDPPPATLFNNERYGNFSYTLPGLSGGAAYTVTLYFAETYLTSSGDRLFDVSINARPVLCGFDIFAAAGGQDRGIDRSFNATASASGQIAVQFTSGVENAKVNGIRVTAGATGSGETCSGSGSSGGSSSSSGSGGGSSSSSGGSSSSSSSSGGSSSSSSSSSGGGSSSSGSGGGSSSSSSGGTSTPCANAITMSNGQSGSFDTTGAVCLRTSATVNGWGCSNFDGRTVSVNGGAASSACGGGPLPLAKAPDGYTYFSVTAGSYPWASLYYW